MGDKDFWPYDGAPSESASTLYQFKEGPNATFVESLKAKHNGDTANPQYVTVETSRKKAKAATLLSRSASNIDILKQLFQCNGFSTGSIQNSILFHTHPLMIFAQWCMVLLEWHRQIYEKTAHALWCSAMAILMCLSTLSLTSITGREALPYLKVVKVLPKEELIAKTTLEGTTEMLHGKDTISKTLWSLSH
jgi:hypothetical protein